MRNKLKRPLPLIAITVICALICVTLLLSFSAIGDRVTASKDSSTSLGASSEALAPKITVQPKPVVTPEGSTAEIAVEAEGEDFGYEWRFADTNEPIQHTTPSVDGAITVKMDSTVDGREIYCIISNKNGTVKTDSVKLIIGNPLKIGKQPVSVTAAEGATAKVSFTAKGDSLTYAWYYKDDGAKKFQLTTNFKGNSYSVTMNQETDGRQVYCIVSDKYGNTLQTKTVTLSLPHSFDQGVIAKQPTCSEEGEMLFTCTNCGKQKTTAIKVKGHTLGNWVVVRETTAAAEGVERRSCADCSYYIDRPIEKIETVWNITVDLGFGLPYKVPVGNNGRYYMDVPSKDGYTFAGWELSDGTPFAEEGTISGNTSIRARWELEGTDTLFELKGRAEKGVDTIKITSDIIISEPIYISHNTTIYSDGDFSLIRHPEFAGDMIVVGQDKNGNTATSMHRKAILTLGGGNGTLSVDGNRDNVTVKVVGSALFVSDSGTLNLHDGARIANNVKLGNERMLRFTNYAESSTLERAGGAAIINLNGQIFMYGGIVENNLVVTEPTTITGEDGVTYTTEQDGCGGAVYTSGTFDMYGGTIADSEALRGGAVYNNRFAYLHAGTIKNSVAHTYGGALSSSSSSYADTHFGTAKGENKMYIIGNRALRAGGALYSNTSSPIIIHGNTEFIENHSDTSGGAIYTAGGLTVRNTVFRGNDCIYSGGAIYHHYANIDYQRRYLLMEDCTFAENRSSLGGAVILSASSTVPDEGTYATIQNCTFKENVAFKNEINNGNGAALYITRNSDATVKNCTFEGNKADTNAGALSIHSGSHVTVPDCTFKNNTASFGGAMYVSSESVVDISDLRFEGNKALANDQGSGGLGGAIYTYGIDLPFENIDFYNNHADSNGGAVYQSACTISPDTDCEFVGNSSGGHGGVFYLTYRTETDGARTGSVLHADGLTFKDNSAAAGGAISIRTDCTAEVRNSVFENNSATATAKGANGGGAIYVGYGELIYEDNVARGNSSLGYGGVIKTMDTDLTLKNCTFESNTAATGGALCMEGGSNLSLSKSTFTDNASTFVQVAPYDNNKGGGAIAMYGAELNIDDVTFDGNSSAYYGGALLTSGTKVTVNGDTVVKNSSGQTGAALMFKGGSNVILNDLEVFGTVGKSNGVIYQNGGALTVNRLNAHDNTSHNGGVFYTSGSATVVTLQDSELTDNTATNNGGAVYMDAATVELSNVKLKGNTAKYGGGIYDYAAKLSMDQLTFEENNAASHGGALALIGVEHTLEQGLTFTKNTAGTSGGAIYVAQLVTEENDVETVTPALFNISDYTFTEHEGGVLSIAGASATANIRKCNFTDNVGNSGGAVAINEATVTLTDSSFKNNTATLGGGLYNLSGKMEISDLIFENNKATNNGGAIDLVAAELDIDETITFKNNSAGNHGGAIYVSYRTLDGKNIPAILRVENNVFENHTAMGGGAVSVRSGCEATFTDTVFRGNSAVGFANTDEGDGEGGGAIYVGYGKLTLNNTTFTENKALATETEGSIGNGGAISIIGSEVTITDTLFEKNEAGTGGALNVRSKATVNAKDVEFKNNVSTFPTEKLDNNQGGGAIKTSGSTLTLDHVTLDGNESAYYGGAVLASSSTVDLINKSLISNNVGTTGGALYFKYTSEITLTDAMITDNTARGTGVIYTNGCSLDMSKVSATGNTAVDGGVLYASTASTVTVKDSTLSKNTSTNGGAAFLNNATSVSVTDTEISENTAKLGGGIYDILSVLELENVALTKNKAERTASGGSGNGGAICLVSAELELDDTVTFTENAAENHGGAVYVSYSTQDNKTVPAKLTANGVTVSGHTAMAGGAFSIRSYCEAILNNVTLENNSALGFTGEEADGNGEGGGAIYVGFGKLAMNNVTLKNNTTDTMGGAVAAAGSEVSVTGGSFEGNTAPAGGALNATSNCEVELKGTTLTANESTYKNVDANTDMGGGALRSVDGSMTLDGVTLESNKTDYYGGALLASASEIKMLNNTTVKNSVGGTGAALYMKSSCQVDLTDAVVADNTSSANGVIYLNNGKLEAVGLTATGNTAKNGGVFYVSGGKSDLAVKDSILSKNSATNGAVLYTADATVTFDNCDITENTATYGGAIASENANITVKNSRVVKNTATATGGALNVLGGTVTLNSDIFRENSSTSLGGAAYFKFATVTAENTEFVKNSSGSNGGAIDIAGSTMTASNGCKFTENTATGHGGAIYVVYSETEPEGDAKPETIRSELTMTDGSFVGNTAMGGGALSIRSGCTATLNGVTLTENSANGYAADNDGDGEGGGAAYVGYGTLHLNNTTVQNNSTDGYGGAVNAVGGKVNVIGGLYENNTAMVGGFINEQNKSVVTIKDAALTANESTYLNTDGDTNKGGGAVKSSGSTLTMDGVTLKDNKSNYYGGTVLASSSTVDIKNSTVEGSIGTTGSALYFKYTTQAEITDSIIRNNLDADYGIIYANNCTLNMTRVAATDNASANGGVLYVGTDAKVTLTDCEMNENSATVGGAVYVTKATLNVVGGEYKNNVSQLGGAIYGHTAAITVKDALFSGNSADKNSSGSNGNGGALYIAGGSITAADDNQFIGNTAANHGGAVYVAYATNEDNTKNPGVLTMTDGLFKENTAVAGGAVSSRTSCISTFTGTVFEKNSATGEVADLSGGALYTNSNTMTLSGVTLDGNSTAYYGGALTALNANVTIKDNTVIKNSVGTTGLAVYLRDGGTCTITDTSLIDNKGADGNGVLYITGAGRLDITRLTATGNSNNNGGVLYASGSAKVTIADSTLKGNHAGNSGGAIDSRATGGITITDSTLTENTARKGGALFLDSGAKVTVNGGTVSKNSTEKTTIGSAGDGGGILIAESSDSGTGATSLTMTGVTLEENYSAVKGGALATDSASPNLLISTDGCIFRSNSSANGGGAIALMNNNQPNATAPTVCKFIFKNSTFTDNSAKNAGGAVEIRTATCAKFDGVNATGNSTTSNGGVFYVTSNFSRLYLTGSITESGNSGNGGFAYLYNNKYSNPPHIYTTHSSSAAWYKNVKGNSTAVTFDLTTLP